MAYTLARKIASGDSNELGQAFTNSQRILQTLDVKSREVLTPIFLDPFRMAMAGLIQRTTQDLNERWRREVYEPCQRTIADRYPFQTGSPDASLADVAHFFNPNNGILWTFYDETLKPFIQEGQDQWVRKDWQGVGVPLSSTFLESLREARLLSDSLFSTRQNSPEVSFILVPYPGRGPAGELATEINMEIGGELLRYRMGPQEQYRMRWPGETGADGAS